MAQSLMSQLHSDCGPEELYHTLKVIRNDVVGHQQRKKLWMGSLDRLVTIINTSDDENIKLQAIYVVGSLAYGVYTLTALKASTNVLQVLEHQ